MGQGLRRASWSEGGGCGGAAGFSFGERPGSNGGSAGRWLLPFPGNGPGTGGVFLGRRGRAAAGRRASLSGRGGFGHVSRRHRCLPPLSLSASPLPVAFPRLLSPAACRPLPPPLSASPLLPAVPPLLTSRTRCLPFPPPCAGRADRWAAAAPRVVGRGAMRRRREVLRNNLENRKILPIFVSVKYRGSGLSRPGFLFFIGLSFLWQKRLSI